MTRALICREHPAELARPVKAEPWREPGWRFYTDEMRAWLGDYRPVFGPDPEPRGRRSQPDEVQCAIERRRGGAA
jgi:hypothetical protein